MISICKNAMLGGYVGFHICSSTSISLSGHRNSLEVLSIFLASVLHHLFPPANIILSRSQGGYVASSEKWQNYKAGTQYRKTSTYRVDHHQGKQFLGFSGIKQNSCTTLNLSCSFNTRC